MVPRQKLQFVQSHRKSSASYAILSSFCFANSKALFSLPSNHREFVFDKIKDFKALDGDHIKWEFACTRDGHHVRGPHLVAFYGMYQERRD